jgi:hypothetical protein
MHPPASTVASTPPDVLVEAASGVPEELEVALEPELEAPELEEPELLDALDELAEPASAALFAGSSSFRPRIPAQLRSEHPDRI